MPSMELVGDSGGGELNEVIVDAGGDPWGSGGDSATRGAAAPNVLRYENAGGDRDDGELRAVVE